MNWRAMVPSTLDRYLVGELYKTFLAVTAVLFLVIFANNFIQSLEKIIGGDYASQDLWQLMFYEMLETLGLLLPPSFYFAVLISLGKLYRDSEIIAIQASGRGPFFLYRTYLVGAIPAALMAALLIMVTVPWAKQSKQELENRQQRASGSIANIETGKFQELQKGQTIFFAEARGAKPGDIKNVFVQNNQNGKLGIISAEEGYQMVDPDNGERYLVLKDGYRYTGEPGQNNYTASQFYEYGILIEAARERRTRLSVKDMNTADLWGSPKREHRVEMHYRVAIPLALLALTFMAIPLSRSLPRQSIWGRLIPAFFVYFAFMNLLRISHKWLKAEETPLWLGMWWFLALTVAVAIMIELRDRYDYVLNWRNLRRLVLRN